MRGVLVAQVRPRSSRLTHQVWRPNGRCINATIVTHNLHFPLDVIIRTTCLNVHFPFFRYLPLRIYVSFLLPSSSFLPSFASAVRFALPPQAPYSPLLLHLLLQMACDGYVDFARHTLACQLLNRRSFIHVCMLSYFLPQRYLDAL